MSFLYGDSTPSTLDIDYIAFVRDTVGFCVAVLEADQRIAQGIARTRALDADAVTEIDRLKKVAAIVPHAFDSVALGPAESASTRCVATIVRSALEVVRLETSAIHAALDGETARRDGEAAREREACVKALEKLLIAHDLPDAKREVRIALVEGSHYAARARISTEFGLVAAVDLDVPAGHLYERVLRIDRLVERLDVQAPEVAGWLHKEVKLRTQHLDRHHVTEISIGPGGAGAFKLRAQPDGTGPGFDVIVSREVPRVQLARIDQGDAPPEPPFAAEDADARKLLGLWEKLAGGAVQLTRHRKALIEAKLDGEPVQAASMPTRVVERLIATVAPVVQEISARSQSPGELVLRRLLGDGKREEIFLPKSELKAKLEPLTESNRRLFDTLWIEVAASAIASPVVKPSPAVRPAPASAAASPLGPASPFASASGAASPLAPASVAPLGSASSPSSAPSGAPLGSASSPSPAPSVAPPPAPPPPGKLAGPPPAPISVTATAASRLDRLVPSVGPLPAAPPSTPPPAATTPISSRVTLTYGATGLATTESIEPALAAAAEAHAASTAAASPPTPPDETTAPSIGESQVPSADEATPREASGTIESRGSSQGLRGPNA